jgi:hypothetical protein
VLDRPIFLGVLLVTVVIAGIAAPVVRKHYAERAAQREMAAIELGLRAAEEGRASAVA